MTPTEMAAVIAVLVIGYGLVVFPLIERVLAWMEKNDER